MNTIQLTDEERQLIGFFLACQIEDRLKLLKRTKDPDMRKHSASQIATIQRLTYTKFIPESLCGDDVLADGSILKK